MMASSSSSFNSTTKLRVVLLNEYGIVYDYCPKGDHVTTRKGAGSEKLMANLVETVLGSVALNYGQHLPVTKVHQLSSKLTTTSVVFGHQALNHCSGSRSETTSPVVSRNSSHSGSRPSQDSVRSSPPNRSGSHHHHHSSSQPPTIKYGLSVLWDTTTDADLIETFIRREAHLLDCFMSTLKDDMMDGLATRSASVLNEAVRRFLSSVTSAVSANYLSTNVSLEFYVRELLTLIRRNDLKSNGFFVSKVLSMVLAYVDRRKSKLAINSTNSDANKLVVVTTSNEEKRPLLERLLIVLSYFMGNSISERAAFEEPQIVANLPPELVSTADEPLDIDDDETPLLSWSGLMQQYQIKVPNCSSKNDFIMNNSFESTDQGNLCNLARDAYNLDHHFTSTLESNFTMSSTNSKDTNSGHIVRSGGRKSRDESLGYGSLSDSGSSNDMTTMADEATECPRASRSRSPNLVMEAIAVKLAEAEVSENIVLDSFIGTSSSGHCSVDRSESSRAVAVQRTPEWFVGRSRLSKSQEETSLPSSAASTCTTIEVDNDKTPTMARTFDQSKLYMREYQSLRFHSPPCVAHDKTCFVFEETDNSSYPLEGDVVSSLEVPSPSNEKRDSFAFFNEPTTTRTVREGRSAYESPELPGFIEMDMPEVVVISPSNKDMDTTEVTERDSLRSFASRAALNENRLLPHVQLQAVYLGENKRVSSTGSASKGGTCLSPNLCIVDMVAQCRCWCASQPKAGVLHVDLDNWSVNIVDAESGHIRQEGLVAAQVAALADGLVAMASLDMHPQFIIGYLETKLNELQLKSQLLKSLAPPKPPFDRVCSYRGSETRGYSLNPLVTMSRSVSGYFYPSDSGFESSLGHSFSSSTTAISVSTVRAAAASVGPSNPWPTSLAPQLGIDVSDIPLLAQLIEWQRVATSGLNCSVACRSYSNDWCSASCSSSSLYGYSPMSSPRSDRRRRLRATSSATVAETAL